MNFLWFYIAIALAISDIIHGQLMWNIFNDFYIVLSGIIHITTKSNMQTWLVHEILEACFHFVVISILFLNPIIGCLAAMVHLLLDITHSLFIKNFPAIPHRAFHFVFESIFFIILYGF